MASRSFIIKIFRINFFTSLFFLFKTTKRNCRLFPILFYGKAYARIDRTSRIQITTGSLDFNYGIQQYEPFIGFVEMQKNAQLIVNGPFSIFSGAHIIIANNAVLTLGSGYINRSLRLKCFHSISIGNNVAISENVTIWDSDVHEVLRDNYIRTSPVVIGNHVWIGTNVTILKGVQIGDNAIIAAGSVVTRSIPQNCMAAGNPAKVIRENISWRL